MPPQKKKKKKTTKPKTQNTKIKEPVPVVPVTEPVAPAPVSSEPVSPVASVSSDDEMTSYKSQISELTDSLKQAQSIIKTSLSAIVKLEKQLDRNRKHMEKELKKKTRKTTANRSMNGFSKPGDVSQELKEFFKLGKDEKIARTEITKKITSYCQENKLQKETDKRVILADEPLKKLLRMKKGDELTYFNLQKYMKIHFPNKEGQFVHL